MPGSRKSSGWLGGLVDFIRKLFRKPKPKPEPPVAPAVLVAVDAGHGGLDSGARNELLDLNEKDVTLAIAMELQRILRSRGFEVIMTRETDDFVELSQRAEIANQAQAEVFVSIHCNSAEYDRVRGIEVYHHPHSTNGKILSRRVHGALMSYFPDHQDRGVKSADFLVLRETRMPASLVETEFLSNPDEARFLADPDNQRRLAEAVANGVEAYLAQSPET